MSFLQNTGNFFCFYHQGFTDNVWYVFISFEWGGAADKKNHTYELIYRVQLNPNYFSVNVNVLIVVFARQFSKNRQFLLKLSVF